MSKIEKLNKTVEQVDYYINRALESLQEDIELKINDLNGNDQMYQLNKYWNN